MCDPGPRMLAAPSADSRDLEVARGVINAWLRRDVEWCANTPSADVQLRPMMWTDKPFRGRGGTVAFVTELQCWDTRRGRVA